MLFINFLCLLYLMVLIDSHTISKSIDNDEKVDDIFDSINDLDHTRNPKLRRDRNLHKYRADYKDEYVRPESFKETKLYEEPERSTVKSTAKATTEHGKHHKSAKRRVGSFWRKFRGKEKKSKLNENQRKRRIPKNKEFATKSPSAKEFRNSSPRNKIRRKNSSQLPVRQTKARFAKRDISANYRYFSTRTTHERPTTYKLEVGITPHIDNMTKKNKFKIGSAERTEAKKVKVQNATEKIMQRIMEKELTKPDNLTGMLATMTTQISRLKEIYGLDKYGTSNDKPKLDSDKIDPYSSSATSTSTRTTEADFPGTAQIEDLLNDIKSKAIQMVSEQNPLVTDIITNTVTEATFEADPILTHIAMSGPGYYLNTFVSINEIPIINEKRTVATTRTNEIYLNKSELITNTESHYIAARSIKEDTMTIAHNVEDMLQRELKNIYNKVKHKVSSDFRKEVHKVKSTVKEGLNKFSGRPCKTTSTGTTATTCTTSRTTPKRTCHCKSTVKFKYKETDTTGPRHTRGNPKVVNDAESTSPTPTYDDYMMLTLYEEMLAKTHEANVRKLLATSELPMKKRREHFRLSKRNPETLMDVKLKETISKLYDDNMPDYDYIDPAANVSSTAKTSGAAMDVNVDPTGTISNQQPMSDSTSEPAFKATTSTANNENLGDTSFEGLSNKISYNDFVNGYKHYLKFQKAQEQDNQNFSALVKYQAHRHHSVDDIGKYILNKIPPVPRKRSRRFFDDTDIDYQEITTKSDDSWFRKHFYLFIDNGPPKKFHTSQTVELKSAATELETKALVTEPMPRKTPKENIYFKLGSEETPKTTKDTSDMSLDDLAKILDSIKFKQSASPYYRGPSKILKEPLISLPIITGTEDTARIPQSFIGKLFGGKRRQAPRKVPKPEFFDMFTENPQERIKRTTKEYIDNTIMDDFISKDLEEKASTGAKEVFADQPSVRPGRRETNKYGYVDIDLVPRQTAVVKLRDDSKRSRFKNFFRKFSFKRNKNKKHVKRSYFDSNVMYTRRQRFNPLKKLKDMFRAKADDKDEGPVFRLPNMPDYDMMTSHIETFKPVKYDKPMTIEEMRKQIPNISDVGAYETIMPRTTNRRLSSYMFHLDDNDKNLLYNYHIPGSASTRQNMLGVRPVWLAGGIPFTGLSSLRQGKETTTLTTREATATTTPAATTTTTTIFTTVTLPKPTSTAATTVRPITRHKSPPSNVMTVNVKTLKKGSRPSPLRTTTRPFEAITNLMTLEDINFILNRIQCKLHTPTKPYQVHENLSTPIHKRGTVSFRRNQPLFHKRPLEELTIKSKLTRIAKFPISKRHFKIRHDYAQPVHIGNDYLGFNDGGVFRENIHELRNRNAPPERRKPQNHRNNINTTPAGLSRCLNSEQSRYTDYFNDLLMWHNDILNLDRVPSPLWKSILNNIQSDVGDTYTTPNMNKLLKELNDITDFLDDGSMTLSSKNVGPTNISVNLLSKPPNTNVRSIPELDKQGVVRSVAMNDNTLMTGKNLIIKGEAKYYQYNKKKMAASQRKSKAFIDSLNKLDVYGNEYKATEKRLVGHRRSESPPFEKEEPAILVDTTILSYDDEADSITKGLEVKKLSRNSEKVGTDTEPRTMDHAYLKTNKAPMQYYTTPLPMKSQDFNKFLKEHKMDVETVTSPMLELGQVLDKWTTTEANQLMQEMKDRTTKILANSTMTTKRVQLTQKLAKMNNMRTLTTAMEKNDKLMMKPTPVKPQKLSKQTNHLFVDFDRYKRYSELNKFARFVPTSANKANKANQEFNYYNIIKKKMKQRLFEKKATALERPVTEVATEVFTIDPHNKEVEITIINFDDLDKITTSQVYENFGLPITKKEENGPEIDYTERTVSNEFPLKEVTSKEYIPKEEMHNGLLYKDIFKDRTTSTTTTEFTVADFTKSTEYLDHSSNETPSVAANKLRFPFDKMPQIYPNIMGKIPHAKGFNVPKRVHISSHHYKYDIFYDDNNRRTFKGGIDLPRPKQSIDAPVPSNLLAPMKHNRARHPHTSATEVTHKRRLFTWRGCKPKPEGGLSAPGEELDTPHPHASSSVETTRVTRRAETTGLSASTASSPSPTVDPSSHPGSLVYDLKHMHRTSAATLDKEKEKETERHRRLFKISALIQDRFKSLMKNLTTVRHTAAVVDSTKRAAHAAVTPKCTCTCKSSKESTTATTEEDEEENEGEIEAVKEEKDGFKITCTPDEIPEEHTHKKTKTTKPAKKKHRKHHKKKPAECHEEEDYVIEDAEKKEKQAERKEEEEECEELEKDEEEQTTASPKHKGHTCGIKHKGHVVIQEMPHEALYVEPETYNDQCYYEVGPQRKPPSSTTQFTEEPDYFGKHYDIKRDIQNQNTFTAKDVAALEVIVDLMKNTLSYEDKDIASVFQNNNYMVQNHATKSINRNDSTNSIQVHIAIPYDFQNGKKRSPLDPVRVRKVFSAKMSTPVDLEYQVHSFEGTLPATTTPKLLSHATSINAGSNFVDGLSPGMYLLVDKPKSGYALKPVKPKPDNMRTRQVPAGSTASMSESKPTEAREETTSIKNLAKVTLSKDFIAAVNKQLIEMYENMTRVAKEVKNNTRKERSVFKSHKMSLGTEGKEGLKRSAEKYTFKRHIDWEAVKKYFGHDRVCNCKCRSNKAMCRACAASDAVIDELIFEFDNLGRYMQDHCTEIQTFFWMNPIGGQKLRESVSRIDKSLGDYYKRVKGKCQGRTCKTFTTYIDKRQLVKTSKVPRQDVLSHLVADLTNIAEDLNRTISLKACFNDKLQEEGQKFITALNNCLLKKSFDKRSYSNTTKRKLIKNVYSLDNINVNIICNPEASSTVADELYHTTALVSHQDSATMSRAMITENNIFDYDITEPKLKKRKGFKKLFPRKNKKKFFTYYTSSYSRRPKINFKREIDSDSFNVATPLISDGGGSFWLNYLNLKATTNEPRVVRDSFKNKPNIEIAVVQKGHDGTSMIQKMTEPLKTDKDKPINSIYMTVKTTPKRKFFRETEATTDYLTHNINQLLQLFGSLQDIEAMNQHSNRSTMFLNHQTTHSESDILEDIECNPLPKEPPKEPPKECKKEKPKPPPCKPKPCKKPSKKPTTTSTTTPAPIFQPDCNKTTTTTQNPLENCDNIIIRGTTDVNSNNTIQNGTATAKTTAASDTSSVASDTTSSASDTTSAASDTTSAAFDTSSGTTDMFPASTDMFPASTDTFPASTDTTTASTDTTTAGIDLSSVLSDSAIANSDISTAPTTVRIVSESPVKESQKPRPGTKSTKTVKTPKSTTKQKPHYTNNRPLFQDSDFMLPTTTPSRSGFFNKLKSATLRFFESVAETSKATTDTTSTTTTTTEEIPRMLPSIRDKFSTGTELPDFRDPAQLTTRPSPTIVIINEYDNQISSDILNDPNKDADGYRNLLLSIIQFESNKLNDEWHRIAYGGDGDKDESDVRRSVIDFGRNPETKITPHPRKASHKPQKEPGCEGDYDILQRLKALGPLGLEIPDPAPKPKKKPPGLLNKIVSKMGIKVVSAKKKVIKSSISPQTHTTISPQFLHLQSELPEIVANKPSLREVARKKNAKRRRRLRAKNMKTESKIIDASQKACDTRRSTESSQICDIQATFDHIKSLQSKLPKEEFETIVKNISCFKYKAVDSNFFVPYKRKGKRWDWIRNKRCLKLHFTRVKEESDFDDEVDVVEFDDDSDSFEKFVKGDDGIYKIVARKKRTANLQDLEVGLRNLPSLTPGQDEMYVMVGDTLTIDCIPHTNVPEADRKYTWRTDRKRMLKQDNVQVEGVKLTIYNVEPRNVGSYTCSMDHAVQRNMRLVVMTIPAFDVVFLPIYKTEETCSYDDLKAIQSLGGMMSKTTRCGKACSIRIDEPVCQRDRGTNSSLLRTTAVLSMTPLNVNCSLQCRRDIVSSLVVLCATNTPVLSSIGVVMSKDGVNETLVPWKDLVRPVVTHSLRKKDTNGHKEYHKLVTTLAPGKVDVVLNCPAGYYLLSNYKLCSSCPANTRSLRGDNTCTRCPRGTHAPPGATECLTAEHPRRYDWWWYPPCGYLVACCGIGFGCTVCLVLSVIVHFLTREHEPKKRGLTERELGSIPKTGTCVTAAYAHVTLAPRTRPLSPSRVILPRFFKPSLTSSRATDSQETKFELWKERNKPPPLPPIDFDI